MFFSVLLISTLLIFSTGGCFGLMIKMDIDDLIRESDVILIGRVTEIKTHLGEKMIYRRVEIKVERYLKNPSDSSEVFVRVLGGEIGEIGVWVEDQPSFHLFEEVLVFLRGDLEGDYRVVGGPQGKFTLPLVARDGALQTITDDKYEAQISIYGNTLSYVVVVVVIILVIYYLKNR